MPFSLSEHEAGCTPLQPCYHCTVAAFLREKLSREDFVELLKLTDNKSAVTYDTPLEGLQTRFSERVKNCLNNDGIVTVGDLVRHTDKTLNRIPNFGRISLAEVTEFLDSIGRRLGELPWEPKVAGGTGA